MSKQNIPVPDCTDKCRSSKHGDEMNAAITKREVTDADLCSYLNYKCCCCESVQDSQGRTALHVAASCSRIDLVRWLVKNRQSNINTKDVESGYTALHRSIFYGKLDNAVELIKLGANLGIQDANGLTFLGHAMADGPKPNHNIYFGELYTWGANINNSLGPQQSRTVPETLDVFHKEYPNESAVQICINQFHSVIISNTGKAYSCGHGQGGRLGLSIQHTEVVPRHINFMNNHQSEPVVCIRCSIARDHTLFLTADKNLYSCGSNQHKVLGLAPPPSQLLVPKQLRNLSTEISDIGTGNYHSLAWGPEGLYTWGLNAGQLGYSLNNKSDDKYILTPKLVRCINTNENSIKLVCASTGATVVYTEKGDIYVLHEYQCRKIASRQLNMVQISVIGGKLNYTLDSELSNKNFELKVAVLTITGSLLVWQETDPVLRQCIFSVNRPLVVKQMILNINGVLFVTNYGEAFNGIIRPRKKKILTPEKDNSKKSDFHKFLEKDECLYLKLNKFSRIHRALNIQSDPNGENCCVIQAYPYKYFDFPDIIESELNNNFKLLLEHADPCDDVTDVIFNVGDKHFPAHRYIISSKSPFLANILLKHKEKIIELKGFHADIFEQFLIFIYTRTCDLLKYGEIKIEKLRRLCKKSSQDIKENIVENDDSGMSAFEYYKQSNQAVEKEKNNENKLSNPVRMLHEMAKRFEVNDLQNNLSNIDVHNYTIISKKTLKKYKVKPLSFDKTAFPDFYDISISCRDNKVIRAHKCILVARLDYFNNMFSARWNGGDSSEITMPFPKSVVEALLEFLYTDSLLKLETKDTDQLFKVIILADQLFVTRLKEQCELLLTNLLTLKNAVQLLSFADTYNADKLKYCCLRFIIFNITSFLEMQVLENLEWDLLKELSDCYFQEKPELWCRVITPYSTAASDEEIISINSLYPINIEEKVVKEKQKTHPKRRIRSSKSSSSDKTPQSLDNSFHFDNILTITDIPETKIPIESSLTNRLQAIKLVNHIKIENVDENFISLSKIPDKVNLSSSFVDTYEFPLLNSPPSSSFPYRTPLKSESKHKINKLSQKQRKRLSSESSSQTIGGSPTLAESPKNPWKLIQNPVSSDNSIKSDNMESIIWSEKKQKENLVKITSKLLAFTQIEDKAIDELKRFYSAEEMEDEIISIERVSMGAIALPVWIPKTK